MKLSVFCLTIFSILINAGCATTAQRQAAIMKANVVSANQTGQACQKQVYDSQEFGPLKSRLPPLFGDVTLQQLTSGDPANDDEIAAILVIHPKVRACNQAFLAQISQTTPTIAVIIADQLTQSENSLIDLIQRKQSWGDHSRRVRDLGITSRAKIVAEAQRIDAALQQSNQIEVASRQRAFEALAQYAQTQQIIDSLNRPTVTSAQCTQFGNTVNCSGVSR